MKKTLFPVLMIAAALLLAACAVPAAGGSNVSSQIHESTGAPAVDLSGLKTMEDVFALADKADQGNSQEAYTDKDYVYVFQIDGIYYRARAAMPEDVSEAVWAIDFFDEDKDQKIRALISPLEVALAENLSEQIPGQEELDKLIGRTGQELFDEGGDYWYYNLEDMEAGLNYGPFSYAVRFDYDGEQMVNSDDFDFYENFKDLTVKSVTYEGLGDASGLN